MAKRKSKSRRDRDKKRVENASTGTGTGTGAAVAGTTGEMNEAKNRAETTAFAFSSAVPAKHVVRWLIPSTSALDRVLSRRNQILNKANPTDPEVRDSTPIPGSSTKTGAEPVQENNMEVDVEIIADVNVAVAPVPVVKTSPKPKTSTIFIGILRNSTFPPADSKSIILKEIYTIPKTEFENSQDFLPKKLHGIQIPKSTFEYFHSEDSIKITVYFLAEALARDLNLRITKKKRTKKKQNNVTVYNETNNSQCQVDLNMAILKTPSQYLRKRRREEKDGPSQCKKLKLAAATVMTGQCHGQGQGQTQGQKSSWTPPDRWIPFEPKLHLSTFSIKYNKSSWSKWPLDHVCIRLAEAINHQGEIQTAADKIEMEAYGQKILSRSILNSRVCSKPECPLSTDDLVTLITLNEASEDEDLNSFLFQNIISEMVKFYQKFKHIHLLLKECLSFWIIKERDKLNRREVSREQRKFLAVQKRHRMDILRAKNLKKLNSESKNTNSNNASRIINVVNLSDESEGCKHASQGHSDVSSSSDNSKLSLSTISAMEVEFRNNIRMKNLIRNQNIIQEEAEPEAEAEVEGGVNSIEMIDLTVSSPSTSTTTGGAGTGSLNSQELLPPRNERNSQALSLSPQPQPHPQPQSDPGSENQNPILQQHAQDQYVFSGNFSWGSSFSVTKISENLNASKTSFNFSTSIHTPDESRKQRKLFVFNKLKETVSHSCILSTLSQLLRMSGANKLLGSSGNQKKFWKFVKQSVFMGGMRSELNLGQLMAHLNPEVERGVEPVWLGNVEDKRMKLFLYAKVVKWLFQDYVLVILRTSFYVTELSDSRYQLAFYLRETWKSVTEKLRWNYLSTSKITPVQGQGGGGGTSSSQVEVTGKLRFIPKKNNSLRPILSHHPVYKKKLDFRLSKYLVESISSSIVSYGVPDSTTIHLKWKRFIGSWKEKGCPTLFFLRTDVRDAYPSVLIEKLTGIIEGFLKKPEKLIMLNYQLKNLQTRNKLVSFVRHTSDRGVPYFIRCRPWNNYIKDKSLPFDTAKATESLKSALNSSAAVVQMGRHKYSFDNGLPQGWTLSQFLCNIYYGTMDNENFSKFIDTPDEFFIRKVDDYFFVSPDPKRVSELYKLMKNGCPDFNCRLNVEKSFNNLYVRSEEHVNSFDKYSCIPFCGWKFCLTSGHLMRDFSSYVGMDSCSTLTFKMGSPTVNHDPILFITERLKYLVPLRLYAMLFDPTFNCRQRILRNVLDASLMAAFRFYAMCRVVFPNLNVFSDVKVSKKIFGGISLFAMRLAKHVLGLERHWKPNQSRGLSQGIKTLHNCGGSGEIVCVGRAFAEADRISKTSKGKTGKRNQIRLPWDFDGGEPEPEPVPGVPTTSGVNPKSGSANFSPILDYELLVIVYHAFIFKLSQHESVFRNNLLPWLRRKRNKYCEKVNPLTLKEIGMVLGNEMPVEFRRIKI